MISFTNPQNIKVFKSFVDQFEKIINETVNCETITISGINEQHKYFNAVAKKNDPFATNPVLDQSIIAINEQICLQLKLSPEEQYAMIAHEIGHILDTNPREINNQLNREYNADQFAINLNLTKELKTGLEKIIESKNYPEEIEDLKKRMKKLP